jgi:hypothetical protein
MRRIRWLALLAVALWLLLEAPLAVARAVRPLSKPKPQGEAKEVSGLQAFWEKPSVQASTQQRCAAPW